MKIVLVSRVYPTHRPGGMPHVCMDRAEALAKAGYEVHVVTTHCSKYPVGIESEIVGDKVFDVHFTASEPEKWSKQFAVCCEALCKRLKPDIVHLDSFDRANPWWNDRPAKRVAVTMHGFGFGAFLTWWNRYRVGAKQCEFNELDLLQEARALALADVVIGVSRWEWRMLRDQYGLRQAKLVYNPIAPYFFEHATEHGIPLMGPVTKQRAYFLCAAVSGSVNRGFDVAVEAAKRAGVELRTVNNAPRRSMPALYDGAKAVVLPTLFAQGYDLTIAEGRARGCPAILTPTGSYLDEAREWDRFVEIGDVEGLALALTHNVEYGPPALVPGSAADEHRPERHVENWLATVG